MVISDVEGLCMVKMVVGVLAFHDCSCSLDLPKWYVCWSRGTSNWHACGTGFCWVELLVAKLRNIFPCPVQVADKAYFCVVA
jgi:hypothetical protein